MRKPDGFIKIQKPRIYLMYSESVDLGKARQLHFYKSNSTDFDAGGGWSRLRETEQETVSSVKLIQVLNLEPLPERVVNTFC